MNPDTKPLVRRAQGITLLNLNPKVWDKLTAAGAITPIYLPGQTRAYYSTAQIKALLANAQPPHTTRPS